jgi:NAD(P)-dependent dehydrogenase (short-subunit alcohol dehydrogenase family)
MAFVRFASSARFTVQARVSNPKSAIKKSKIIMSDRVKGKIIIVTGAAQGIGFGIAEMCAKEGASVVIGDVNAVKGSAASQRLNDAGHTAIFQRCDVESEDDCKALIDVAVQRFGRLDGLVNNAGYYPRATLEETTTEFWEKIMRINARGPFYCCKYALPAMRNAGGGSIVNIGSGNGIQAIENLFAYGAAKGAVLNMTRTLAAAHARDRIRVNYLIPGWVLSEGEIALHESMGTSEAELRERGKHTPLGRQQTPQDAAYGALFLLSDESSQTTGTVFQIDAGWSSLHFPRSA